jgi:hypothetical protein
LVEDYDSDDGETFADTINYDPYMNVLEFQEFVASVDHLINKRIIALEATQAAEKAAFDAWRKTPAYEEWLNSQKLTEKVA